MDLFSIAVCFGLSSLAFERRPSNRYDLGIYKESLELCLEYNARDTWKFFYGGVHDLYWAGRILQFSSKLEDLLKNDWFYAALEVCFQGHKAAQVSFISGLIGADIAGKASGILPVAYISPYVSLLLGILKLHSLFAYSF